MEFPELEPTRPTSTISSTPTPPTQAEQFFQNASTNFKNNSRRIVIISIIVVAAVVFAIYLIFSLIKFINRNVLELSDYRLRIDQSKYAEFNSNGNSYSFAQKKNLLVAYVNIEAGDAALVKTYDNKKEDLQKYYRSFFGKIDKSADETILSSSVAYSSSEEKNLQNLDCVIAKFTINHSRLVGLEDVKALHCVVDSNTLASAYIMSFDALIPNSELEQIAADFATIRKK